MTLGVCILIVARGSDYLLVDISNSYAKFAFASTTRVFAPTRIVTGRLSTRLVAQLVGKRNVGKMVVSSVVPAETWSHGRRSRPWRLPRPAPRADALGEADGDARQRSERVIAATIAGSSVGELS